MVFYLIKTMELLSDVAVCLFPTDCQENCPGGML